MSSIDALRDVKLNPLTLLLLLAGLVVIAYAALSVSFLRRGWDREALSSQIESAEAVLATAKDVRQDLSDLPARLDTARQQLAVAQTAFPSDLDSNTILQAILGYANESQVRLLEVHIQPLATESGGSDGEIEASAYRVLGFDLEVEGTFEQLVTFLAAVEEGATSTSRIGAFSLQESDGRQLVSLEFLSYARAVPDGGPALEDLLSPEDGLTDGERASNDEAP